MCTARWISPINRIIAHIGIEIDLIIIANRISLKKARLRGLADYCPANE